MPDVEMGWWQAGPIQLAAPSVDVSKLDGELVEFLKHAAELHNELFSQELVITSGNDGQHVAHSAHYLNFAADIRSRDLTPDEQMLFGLVLSFIAPRYKIVVFDERATPGQHWHVQTAASAGA